MKKMCPHLLLIMFGLWGFRHNCYWGPRNTCKHKRELKHFLTQLTLFSNSLTLMTLVDVLISDANQLKAPKKTPVNGLSCSFFTFPSVHARCLMLEVTLTLDHLLFPVCKFCYLSPSGHLMKLLMAQIMFWCLLIRKLKEWYDDFYKSRNRYTDTVVNQITSWQANVKWWNFLWTAT